MFEIYKYLENQTIVSLHIGYVTICINNILLMSSSVFLYPCPYYYTFLCWIGNKMDTESQSLNEKNIFHNQRTNFLEFPSHINYFEFRFENIFLHNCKFSKTSYVYSLENLGQFLRHSSFYFWKLCKTSEFFSLYHERWSRHFDVKIEVTLMRVIQSLL